MAEEREVWKLENGVPKISDVVGKTLGQIGAYGELNNTEQVVALIDEVSQEELAYNS